MKTLCAIWVLVLCLAWPAGASAGVAFAEENEEYALFVEFYGEKGEANDLTVTVRGKLVTFHDSAAPVVAGELCDEVDTHTATCPVGDVLDAWTHDGPDTVHLDIRPGRGSYPDVGVIGGGGDDTLIGSAAPLETFQGESGDDVLIGGPRTDVMFGGRGDDVVSGGDGHDRLWGDGASKRGRDTITGGPGIDTVFYGERERPVAVDLRRAGPQGAPGEGDTVTEVENVAGGHGADHLIGNAEDNLLIGNGGADVFACGQGSDLLREVASQSVAPGDCEGVRARSFEVGTDARTDGGSEVRIPLVQSPRRYYAPFCRAVVELSGPFPAGAAEWPPTMGTGEVRTPLGKRAVVRVRLNEHGRELLARPGRVRVLVSFEGDRDCKGVQRRPPSAFTLLL